jgi:hypothetical protein
MRPGTARATAISVAALRAAHLHLFDGAKIHEDTFALQLSGAKETPGLARLATTVGMGRLRPPQPAHRRISLLRLSQLAEEQQGLILNGRDAEHADGATGILGEPCRGFVTAMIAL